MGIRKLRNARLTKKKRLRKNDQKLKRNDQIIWLSGWKVLMILKSSSILTHPASVWFGLFPVVHKNNLINNNSRK